MILGRRKKQEDQDQAQRNLIISYKRIFGSPEGKEILFDLMNRFHVLNGHNGDAIKEGQRSAVLFILAQCHIKLEDFDKLLNGEI